MTRPFDALQVAAVLSETPDNLYTLHQSVANFLCRSRAEDGVERGYLYRVAPYAGGVAVVARVRGSWLSNLKDDVLAGASAWHCPVNNEGQRLTISVRVSPIVRQGSREKAAPDNEKFVRDLLTRNGMDPLSVHVGELVKWPMYKKGFKKLLVRVIEVKAEVCVRDVAAAQAAWLHGVGRFKAFGLGMMIEY